MKKILITFLVIVAITASAQRGYVHDAMDAKYGEPGREALNNWMYGNLMNVKVEPTYVFKQTAKLHLTEYKNGLKKK